MTVTPCSFAMVRTFFYAGAVAEVFDVDGIDFTAFDSIIDEIEVVAFRNFHFAAFFFSAEREQDCAVR